MSKSEAELIQSIKELGYVVFKPIELPKNLDILEKNFYESQFVPSKTFAYHKKSELIQNIIKKLQSHGLRTMVPRPKLSVLAQAMMTTKHLVGEVWEAGVYQGGTALLLSEINQSSGTRLRLFDTFDGMPETNSAHDYHRKGDFQDTSLETVRNLLGNADHAVYHKGFVPDTFKGLEDCKIKFVHIDLDIYDAILETLKFVYERMPAGIFVFDDYGSPTCPGARKATDEFFADKPEKPIALSTGQAIVIKWA